MRDPSTSTFRPDGDLSVFDAFAQGVDGGILLAICALLGAALVAALFAFYLARQAARASAEMAEARSREQSELLRTVRMAEEVAELGFWQFNPATQSQQWSAGMRTLFGVEYDEPFLDGDAETVLFATNIDLIGSVRLHADEVDPYELRFDITDNEGRARTLSAQASNIRLSNGDIARVIAVVRDVTQQVAQQRELELSRERAVSEAETAKVMASTDGLTGLANRRHVMSELDRMLVKTRRSRDQLALILFDLDHFKSINDTYGHPEGDKVLRKVAQIAQAQARDTDLVGRVGGEEFVWIVPGVDEEIAHSLAERLRKEIAAHGRTGAIPSVTTSVGCAEMHPGDSSLSLFARADGALYEAKNSGRNQVRIAA